MMSKFQQTVNFQIGLHYVFIQPRRDPQGPWLTTQYVLTEEDLENFISDWLEEWQ